MDDDLATLLVMCAAYVAVDAIEKKKKRSSFRTNPYPHERKIKGRFHKDFEDLKKDPKAFMENFHMDVETFNAVFEKVQPHLLAKCNPADKISPEEKFAVVLGYFASGSLHGHMASICRISKQHMGTIIDEVSAAICVAFHTTMKPLSRQNMLISANNFKAHWQFPNCAGAIDGKYVVLKAPRKTGSLFYNYKEFQSLVLLAVADAQYKFTYVNIEAFDNESDANIFSTSKFGRKVINDDLDFPADVSIGGANSPYFFVTDDAFPLCKRIMKPYDGRQHLSDEERIFNYRLSRARKCVDNAFGILVSRWLCLKKTMPCSPDRAKKIVIACCLLHNHLLGAHRSIYCPTNFADHVDEADNLINGNWRKVIAEKTMYGNFLRPHGGKHCDAGVDIRNALKKFVNSPVGSVPWQRQAVFLK